MKNPLRPIFLLLLAIVCLIPAPASAARYYYRGHYYPYRYRGAYYNYYWHGGYYNYYWGGRYYLHRRWVAGPRGYYRYW